LDVADIPCSSSGLRFPAPGISRSITYLGILAPLSMVGLR
jgi:hypothetical protein